MSIVACRKEPEPFNLPSRGWACSGVEKISADGDDRLRIWTENGDGHAKTITKTSTKDDATITKDDWAVLQIIRENPVVTAEEIGDKLGLTRAGAIYHINKLKKITKIRRVGTPRNGHWEVM